MKAILLSLVLTTACVGGPTRLATGDVATRGQVIVDSVVRARIDSTLRAFVQSGTVAGVSALVHEKGREVYFNAFGMADREANRPMARNTIVQIFSMTKPVTGVALMQLFEQGRFQLDDPVAKYAPEFANMKVWSGKRADGSPILVEPRRSHDDSRPHPAYRRLREQRG
jgi:CubicO group peptidase (beta-lactamase class C family)